MWLYQKMASAKFFLMGLRLQRKTPSKFEGVFFVLFLFSFGCINIKAAKE